MDWTKKLDENRLDENRLNENWAHEFCHTSTVYLSKVCLLSLSENLRRVIKNYNVNLHFKSNFKIKNKVTKLKDKIKLLFKNKF